MIALSGAPVNGAPMMRLPLNFEGVSRYFDVPDDFGLDRARHRAAYDQEKNDGKRKQRRCR
jgi:hypothetical protein